jgi:hypothetical protein
MAGTFRCGARVVITITLAEVSEIAETVHTLPDDFDPAAWLAENREDIAIVATEAVRDVVWEALEIGLADHPLVLRHRMAGENLH